MRYLLTPKGRRVLRDRMHESPLLGFDFDGTLSPIVAEPDRATLPPQTRALLHQVALRFPCVVLSGRARQDVMQRLGDLPLREVFGNHGLEPWHMDASELAQLQGWAQTIAHHLAERPGIWIEDKRFSLSVHYRHCTDQRGAEALIQAVLAELPKARIVPGKCVYNVMPSRTIHKGTVFREAMLRFGSLRALYVGDDHTDEDVFASCDAGRVLTVRIGASSSSRATYYLHAQAEINDLLEFLIDSDPSEEPR